MNWINELIWGQGVGHSILLLSFVIALGIQLGKIKIFGVSLGITFVLFVGIIMGHFGITINPHVIHFFQEFGVFSRNASRTRFLLLFQTRWNHFEYVSVRCNLLGCLDHHCDSLHDKYPNANDGRYFIRSCNQHAWFGCCPAGIFRYAWSE